MKFDYKGIMNKTNAIQDFVHLLETVDNKSIWNYKGLTVTIYPTVDFNNENVLMRWTDIHEGFNDRIIYQSLNDFKKDFTLVNA